MEVFGKGYRMRVLIVDDELVNRELLEEYLTPYGKCDLAENGSRALELFKQAIDDDKKYDLILLDIMMPGISGQDVLKEMRRIEEDELNILYPDGARIIMTSALYGVTNVLPAWESLCDAYLIKPIDQDVLFKEIKTLGLIA